jgi:hypothetical protein
MTGAHHARSERQHRHVVRPTKQRLLVIVDALSERQPETQQHVQQVFTQDVPLNALVITSRTEPSLGALDRTVLYPLRLDAASIVPFIIGYLNRMEAVPQLKDGRIQLLHAPERMWVQHHNGIFVFSDEGKTSCKPGSSPPNVQSRETASRSQRFDLFFQLLDFLSQPSRSLA